MNEALKIINFAGVISNIADASGLTFKQVEIGFRSCIFMMEEIEKNRDVDEEQLTQDTLEFIKSQL